MREARIRTSLFGIPIREKTLPYNKEVVLDSSMHRSLPSRDTYWIVGPALRVSSTDGTLMKKGIDLTVYPPELTSTQYPLDQVNNERIESGRLLKRKIVVRKKSF